MYELRRRDYERIINQMVNLVIDAIICLQEADCREAAAALGRSLACVLADYDDDIAVHIETAMIT